MPMLPATNLLKYFGIGIFGYRYPGALEHKQKMGQKCYNDLSDIPENVKNQLLA